VSSDGDIWSSHVRCHVVSRSASDRALFDIALTKTVASSNAAVCDAQSRFLFNNRPTFAAAGRRVAALRVGPSGTASCPISTAQLRGSFYQLLASRGAALKMDIFRGWYH